MRSAIRRLAHDLPPNAAGALALVGLFVVISALALVAPRTPRERAEDLAVASAPPSSSTTAPRARHRPQVGSCSPSRAILACSS